MEILVKPFPSFIKRLKEKNKRFCTRMEIQVIIRGRGINKGVWHIMGVVITYLSTHYMHETRQ